MAIQRFCACGNPISAESKGKCRQCFQQRKYKTPDERDQGYKQYKAQWRSQRRAAQPDKAIQDSRKNYEQFKGDTPEQIEAWRAYLRAAYRVKRARQSGSVDDLAQALMVRQEARNLHHRLISPEFIRHTKAQKRRSRTKARRALIDFFSARCVKCGYDTDWRALQLDHINGDGWKERRGRNGLKVDVYSRLRQVKADPVWARRTFQVLCANCNQIKVHENEEFADHKDLEP